MAVWHTTESIRDAWSDAEQIGDDLLGELLEVAKEAILAYAPRLVTITSIPTRYRVAQMVQVKNLWNAARVTVSGDLGGDTYEIQPRPLDWHVRQILRPAQGVPRIG